MEPKVLLDLFSPRGSNRPDVTIRTYVPNAGQGTGASDEIIPPPPKAGSAVDVPVKK